MIKFNIQIETFRSEIESIPSMPLLGKNIFNIKLNLSQFLKLEIKTDLLYYYFRTRISY